MRWRKEEEEEEDTAPVSPSPGVCVCVCLSVGQKIWIYIRTGLVSGVQSLGHHRSGWQQGAISSPSSTSSAEAEEAGEAEETEETEAEEAEETEELMRDPEVRARFPVFPIMTHRMSPVWWMKPAVWSVWVRFRPEARRKRIRRFRGLAVVVSGLISRRHFSHFKVRFFEKLNSSFELIS